MKQLQKPPAKRFEDALLQLSRTQPIGTVFDDFLDFALLFIRWWEQKHEDYSALGRKYPEVDAAALFAEAYIAMADVADDNGAGFKDPFGDFYMEHLSKSRSGQFFTPETICDFMDQIQLGEEVPDNATVTDPCCGSGRLLLSAAKINRKVTFYAADIDLTCAKMTLLNFLLNSMCGEVAWMDSLGLKHFRNWKTGKVMLDNGYYVPYYKIIAPEESAFSQYQTNQTEEQQPTTTTPTTSTSIKRRKPKTPSPQLILEFK